MSDLKKVIDRSSSLLKKGIIDPYSAAEMVYREAGLNKIHKRCMEFARWISVQDKGGS